MLAKRLLRRIALPMIALLLASTGLLAQDRTVTGKVTDSKDGSPVAGASVVAKGSSKGTSTNTNGEYSISVPSGVTKLAISSVGFTSQEVDISGANTADVSFVANAGQNLNEVVVVGYGTARKKDLTGAVGSIKAKDFNQGFVTSPDQLLQNKISGLEITNNSGQPGVATTIKIRGNNSIRAVNNPLYVVDGVPLDGRTARPSVNLTQGFGSTPESNPLLYINPNDIAQIDVLKDASSAAIYGSRGANGVIVITTKKAASGGTKLEFGTSFGVSAGYLKKYEILDAGQFRAALKKYNLPASLDKGKTIDALKEITQTKLSNDYSLALSSGNENGRLRASFLASRARGFLKNSNLDKYLGSFGGQYKFLDKKLSVDFNLRAGSTSEDITNVSNTADSKGNLISSALSWNPTESFTDNTGKFVIPGNGSGNPLAFAKAYSDIAKVNSVLADISAGYKLLENLEYKFLFAINHGTGERNTNIDGWLGGYNGISGLGIGAKSFAKLTSQTITHTLNYRAKLSSKITLDALAGFEYWKTDYSGSTYSASGFNTNLTEASIIKIKYTDILANGNTQSLPSTFVNPTTELKSYFGRAVLNFMDKYLLTATVRADGSSKFGKNNRYGYFPSVAAKWNISNEDFMKGSSVFSNLSLRGSWGVTGNQEFPAGASQEQFGFSSYNSAGQFNVANPDLKWESTRSYNVGLDYAILGGKVYGSLDYYDKNTTDILFQSTAIQPAPASIYFINLPANLTNKGIEFSVGASLIDRKDFGLDVNFNISNNKNLLTNFYSPGTTTPIQILTGQINGQGVSGTLSQIITNNQPVNEFYLKKFNGFDANGNQLIAADPAFSGDPNPHTIYGVGTGIRFKKFALSINTGGAAGFLIYNNTATNITNLAGIIGGRNVDLAAYNSAEKTVSSAAASTRFLEKGDYFKLRNASLRYNVGNIGKHLKGLTAFVSGSNLFVLTKFTGFDPEVNIDKSSNNYPSRSIEYVPYPTPRTVTFGFNLSL
jgi:TonB-dependent starch-binding outer membrane protein SusC